MKKQNYTPDDMVKVLDAVYEQSIKGIGKVSQPIEKMANNYLDRYSDRKEAIKKMLNFQIAKCTTSGFITGFGGLIVLPVAIPANIGSVLYVQMRMIAATAYMAGYDLQDDQVQTFVYVCLAGISINEIVKNFGVKFANKIAIKGVEKIPGKVLVKINQKVGFRLLTKFGEKGLINIAKVVPVAGAAVNAGLDFAETKVIANRAYHMFVDGDFDSDDMIIDENMVDSDEAKRILGDSEF